MEMPFADMCRRLKEASDLQIELSTRIAAMKDPAERKFSLRKLRDWDADDVVDEIDVYVRQLKDTFLQCDRGTAKHHNATTSRLSNSVEASSQAKEELRHLPSSSTNARKHFANQENTIEAGSYDGGIGHQHIEHHIIGYDVMENSIPSTSSETADPKGLEPGSTEDSLRAFVCTHCSRRFHRQEHLTRHYRSLYTREKPFRCNSCGNRFSRSDNLAQHRRLCDD